MSLTGASGINYKLAVNPSEVNATSKYGYKLGDYANHKDGVFQFVQASENIGQYDAVKVDNDGTCVRLTTTISGAEPTAVGFAQIAITSGQRAWVFRGQGGGSGVGIRVNALTLCAADVKLYTTATAGAIDDTATDLIQGVCLVTTNSGGSTAAMEVFASQLMVTNAQD